MNKSLGVIGFLLFIMSCTSNFDPDWQLTTNPNFVVNGILFPDSLPKIKLGKTKLFEDGADLIDLSKSEVFLIRRKSYLNEQEVYKEQLKYQDSLFVGDSILQEGFSYQLEVITPQGEILKADTEIPETVSISKSTLLFPAGYTDLGNKKGPFMRIMVEFTAPPENNSYFESYICNADTFSTHDNQLEYHILKAVNNDQLILSEDLPGNYLHAFLFSTDVNADPLLELSFDIMSSGAMANPFFTEFYPVISHVSKEYYLYKKSLYNHLDALNYSSKFETKDFYSPDIFKVIPKMYSNINGGVGIFAGVNPSTKKTICNEVGYACQ